MEFFRYLILIVILLFSSSFADAQQNYNPFQYGGIPNQSGSNVLTPDNIIHRNNQIFMGGSSAIMQPYQYQNGISAQDIIAKQYENAMQMMNMPNLPTQNQDVFQMDQIVQQKRWQEIQHILSEINTETSWSYGRITGKYKVQTDDYVSKQKMFEDVFQKLNSMLSGKEKLSIENAYYYVENTVDNNYFSSHESYKTLIKKSVDFIKVWMKQNGRNLSDKEQVHTAIQKFMSENLSATMITGTAETGFKTHTVTHSPFFYDYNDYQAQKDARNSFVTKCWATGSGQCSSMPVIYLSLAQGLGVKAYLSLAPYHTFIKYPDNTGKIQNYEPTSNWIISDAWYQQNMFISSKAKASGIFLDTLNTKQVIADCMVNLAVQYMRTLHNIEDSFVLQCLYRASDFFPKKNHIQTYFALSEYLANKLMKILKKHNADKSRIAHIPEALAVFREMVANEDYIKMLGYQEMPAGMYDEMMNEQAMKGEIQILKGIEGKQKRNLFTEIK
jgi:RNA polymerase-interacting CarD/CdnL/TRCF family regulator